MMGKVEKLEGSYAWVNINNTLMKVSVELIDNLHVGDIVIVYTGYVLEKVIDNAFQQIAFNYFKEITDG